MACFVWCWLKKITTKQTYDCLTQILADVNGKINDIGLSLDF